MFDSSSEALKSKIKSYSFLTTNPINPSATASPRQRIGEIALPILDAMVQHNRLIDGDASLMVQEEIEQYSLLDQKFASLDRLTADLKSFGDNSSLEHILIRFMANLLGGGLITGGKGQEKLDGFLPIPNFSAFATLLEQLYQEVGNVGNSHSKEMEILANIKNGIYKLKDRACELARFNR
jgi:hypothetical protein